MERMDEATKAKLQKIITLMDNAGTPGEAEAAAAAMSRFLVKFNLSEQEARATTGEKAERSKVSVRSFSVAKPRERGLTWKILLLNTVAKHNLCELIRIGLHGGDCWIVGTELNVDYVINMYFHLSVVFERLANESWTRLDQWNRLQTNRVKYVNNFMLGVPNGLHAKFLEDRKRQTAEDPRVGQLVVVNNEDLERAIAEKFGNLNTGGKVQVSDSLGYAAGYQAGKSYTDSKPVTDHARLALK